jgi:hypothetical protein
MTEPEPSRPHDDDRPFFEQMREQILATQLPDHPSPLRGRRRRRGRRLLWRASVTGIGVGLAAAITAVVLALAAGSDPQPAYAVTVNPDHSVTIILREFRAIGQLNARLAALRTRIRAVPIVPGCIDRVHSVIGAYRGIPAHVAPGPAKTLEVDGIAKPSVTMTTAVDTLSGRTSVFAVTRSGMLGDISGPGDGVVIGPAPRCVGDGGRHLKVVSSFPRSVHG